MNLIIFAPAGTGVVQMSGSINETSEGPLQELAAQLPLGPLRIDCEKIEYINSVGVMRWIEFLAELARRQIPVTFERCAPVFFDYAKMIPSFAPSALIKTLLVPFSCQACGDETLVVITRADLSAEIDNGTICKACGGPAAADRDYYV